MQAYSCAYAISIMRPMEFYQKHRANIASNQFLANILNLYEMNAPALSRDFRTTIQEIVSTKPGTFAKAKRIFGERFSFVGTVLERGKDVMGELLVS